VGSVPGQTTNQCLKITGKNSNSKSNSNSYSKSNSIVFYSNINSKSSNNLYFTDKSTYQVLRKYKK